MRQGRFWIAVFLLPLSSWTVWSLAQPPKNPTASPAATEPDDAPSAEEEKEKAVAERFRKVLETNPRRGTALDRLYGYHVERGTLDQLINEYATRTKNDPKDGIAWMIVGLLESQRGRDALAVAAFRPAEASLPDNAMPPYYLGQSLVLLGQPDAAAEAFERAIARKPNRNDLLDAFQALGRVYQRAQRTEQALGVWSRLEKQFPDDARVQEQIATTLVEEGQFAQALPRLEKLSRQTEDKYRQSSLRMDAAELKVKLKKSADALADFEKLLGELDPESWLCRDVRRRIEDVFLRSDDLAGLTKYYERWLEKNPADVDAISRLAKSLSTQGRAPEARHWLEKGVAVAPTQRSLRQALIDQFVFEQNFAAAAQQYEALGKAVPNNPDVLRDWGKVLLRDAAKPEADRRAAATAVWKRMLANKPNDAVTASQVADLMRTANLTDDAIALYKKAIELAPNAPQYREYLGEYYHNLKKSDEALATWRPIAEGPNRNSKNLVRLAEVFAGFGYRKEAIDAMADAIGLEKDDFAMLMTYAELLHQEGRNDDALQQIALAGKLTSNPEETEQVLNAQIRVYQATETLDARIDELQKELDAAKEDAAGSRETAERWLRLARLFEANRQFDKATETIVKAIAKDGKSVPVMIAAARIFESGGDLLAAADANRKLAILDRRFRTEYLTAVTKLEQRLGRREQALQAGRDLLAASPGNPEVYKFFADLCFQLGDQDEGLEALRRSVRANPSDAQGLITLANALGERVRQGEAIELLWRALEKTNELEGKLGVIERITQLYLENNQLDRLLERLERERRESDKAREMAMCIAQVHTTAGDLGTARLQLERLLLENTRDTHLLGQLSTLCDQEGDLASAVKYQRQLIASAPNNYDHQLRLAQLLTRTGESEEAADIWVKLVANDTEPHRNLSAIDSLLTAGKSEAALAVLSRLLARKPGDWELTYREGAALTAKGKPDEAAHRFQALLAMKAPDDDLSAITRNQIKQARKKAPAAPNPNQPVAYNPYVAARTEEWNAPPLTRRTQNVYRVRSAVGMDSQNYYGGGVQPFYSPSDFGEARMASLGWLYEAERARNTGDAFVKSLKSAQNKPGSDLRALWDWYYFQTLRQETKDSLATALALSKGNDPAGLLAYLNRLGPMRSGPSRMVRRGPQSEDITPPLPADQLDHAIACFRKLRQLKPEWADAAVTAITTELKRAKRDSDETAIFRDMMKDATTVTRVQLALSVAVERADMDAALALFAKLEQLQGPPKTNAAIAAMPTRLATTRLEHLLAKLIENKKFPDALKVYDTALATAKRQNLAAPRTASATRRQQTGGLSGFIPGKVQKRYQVAYPSPNDYYDLRLLHILYTAFAKAKEADLQSDLFAHVARQLASAQGADRLYTLLALGYLQWWAGEKDEALAQLSAAIQAAPSDHNLLMEVAGLREQNNEFDAALALLDSFSPLDTQMMQRREEAALRLAERTGNMDRARRAAERMFGLRLDADKQLELAGKMHRLGMHELAETVLGRAQRQAGNKTATLVRLMIQYQNQNQGDLAMQIARQILRKGPSISQYAGRGGMDDGESARSQAIGVLARSGQLKEMIERAEAQLKSSPKSVQVHQALASYYQAAGDKAKLKATLVKMAELKPDDGKLRFLVAQQLEQAGERGGAIDQYKAAIKLEPSLFGNNYYQIQNLFMRENRLEELAKVFDEVDMRKVGHYYYAIQPVSNLMQDDRTRDLGMKLFKKAWEAYPQYRSYILGQMYDENIWRMPEMYGYAKDAVIPRDDSEIDPWQSTTEAIRFLGDGRADGVISRMMSIARKQQRLLELRAEVADALAKRPEWTAGKALLAVIDIQSGHKERGKQAWREVFDDAKISVPAMSRYLFCQELEFYAGVEEMAVKSLEAGADEIMRDGNQFSYGPGRRLVWWYQQLGRTDDARKLLRKYADPDSSNDPGYGSGSWQYRLLSDGIAVAQEFMTMGDSVEAVRVYSRLLADKTTFEQAAQYGGGDRFEQQIEQGLKTALKAIKPRMLPAAVGVLLTPRPATPTDPSVLDLVVLVDSRELTKSTLTSVLANALKSTESNPELRREALAKVADLAQKHPRDFSVQTAAALVAFADGKPDAIREAVDRLVKLMESTPLEPLPPSGKANSRQRTEALPQVALWLVARECLAKDRSAFWPAGEKLAERASAAGKRQEDPSTASAILREWGQMELDRGDKAKAELRWGELLELAVPKPALKKAAMAPSFTAPNAATVLFAVQQPVTAVSVAPIATLTSSQSGNPSLTADQFQRAYELAILAVEKGLPELSLRAMREALRSGPPLPAPQTRGGGGYMARTINGVQYLVPQNSPSGTGRDQALVALVPKWRGAKVPIGEIYSVLAAAVLPESRPGEVFGFAEAKTLSNVYVMSGGTWTPTTDSLELEGDDRGLAGLLVETAIEAGKADDLRTRLEARAGQPLGELPARLLLALLAIETKDDGRALKAFESLGERVKKDSTLTTNDRVSSVVLPAFANPKYAGTLAPIVQKLAENYASSNSTQKAIDHRFKLADYHLNRKDEPAARAQYKAVEGFGKSVGRNSFDPHMPLARQYLKAGWVVDALRELGTSTDNATAQNADPRSRSRRADPTFDELPRLVGLLQQMPADQRYQALKDWTLPTAGRNSVRYLVGTTPKDVPPAGSIPIQLPVNSVISTMLLLADAARECGKIDELIAEIDKLDEKTENAELLKVLTHLAAGKGARIEPALKSFAESARQRMSEKAPMPYGGRYYYDESDMSGQPAQFRVGELLFAELCLADSKLASHGEGLLPSLQNSVQNSGRPEYVSRVREMRDRLTATRAGAADVAAGGVPSRWHAATSRSQWFAQDGYLVQTRNDQPSFLLFDSPLGGTFEYSVDVWQGGETAGNAGYGGVVFDPTQASIWTIGKKDLVRRQTVSPRHDQFNRLTVQVSPAKVRCLVNGKLFYEDTEPPPTSPWCLLMAEAGHRPVFRNFVISGEPHVLAEVKLSAGNYLDGWHADMTGGNLPQRLVPKEPAPKQGYDQWGNYTGETEAKDKEPVYDWRSVDGEILGRKLVRPSEKPTPSRLAYFRPMRPGETVRYQFFHEPGRTHVYPSLGRLAFLMEPDGVKLHWITDKVSDDWTGLAADNVLNLPSGQRGPIALKAGVWNTLALTTTPDGVKIDVNGVTVCEMPLSADLERTFGLFHYRDRTAARVRNVVLKGPWPRTVGTAAEIALNAKPANVAQAKARRQQLGERYYHSEAGEIVSRAAKLPPAEKYKLLADWVLPTESRPAFQLAGKIKPLDVLGVVDGKQQPNGRRIMLGSQLEVPCLEMVAAARECGALDELAERVTKSHSVSDDDSFRRAQTALLAVVRAAQGRDADSIAALQQLAGLAEKQPPDAPGIERWPDLIAAAGTMERPALAAQAAELLRIENRNLDQSMVLQRTFADRDWWIRAFRTAQTKAAMQGNYSADGGFVHWAPVSALSATGRSAGWSVPAWVARDNLLMHYPGHSDDYLVLRTPLRGDFEVTCGLKLQGWQEAHVRYGSHQFDLNYDGKKHQLHNTVRNDGRLATIDPPIALAKDNCYQLKIAVKDGWFRAFVDGREIVADKIGPSPDPWLMLHAAHLNTAEIRDFRITGAASVPDSINMLADDDLGMWRPYAGTVLPPYRGRYYYPGQQGWLIRGEEMYEQGRKPEPPEDGKPESPRSFPESATFYQRPMLEDGAVEYEFFFDPDKALVHPMLDRLTFLLEPDGVRLHWLTDGAADQSGVPFDNAFEEKDCRRGPAKLPLNAKAWNKVRLSIAGDTVKLSLNDAPIYERPIEPTNQRLFGLFHYVDRTEARVRSMTMTGDWPKQVPPNEKLFEVKK